MARVSFNELAYAAGSALPPSALRAALRLALADLSCALCLHRALPQPRATDWQPGLNMPPAQIDALLELLLTARPGAPSGWLTVTFDDGYRDAADYLRSRAPRFPEVEFLFFVNPEKAASGAGFRWDLAELQMRAGVPRGPALGAMEAPLDLEAENRRDDLLALGQHPDFALSTVEELTALARQPNITLGNHTDLHAPGLRAPEGIVHEDYRRSTERFGATFGRQRHFAFPYGTPGVFYGPRQVARLRELGDFLIWSTEARPYHRAERRPGAVLPRFPVDGTRSSEATAALIAARALKFRLRGSPHAG